MGLFNKKDKELEEVINQIKVDLSNNYKDNAVENIRKLEKLLEEKRAGGKLKEKDAASYSEQLDAFKKDVANFCNVNLNKGLFYFDSSFRPIPLKQLFIGITEKKGIKKLMLINEIAYNKIIERLNDNKQIIVFVHS